MSGSKCTLKDIALRCGVSPAIVSTVLNGKEGQMKCSAARREQIFRVAGELEYHPNILARSIKEKRVPIVGVFLRNVQGSHVLSRFISSRLGVMSTILNKMQYEVLFVPYSDPAEQYTRMKSLIARGLLGGIVTNIDYNDNQEICRLLQESKLPYLVLGKPAFPDTYCVYISDALLEKSCFRIAEQKNCSRCISVAPGKDDQLVFRSMPFPDGHVWAAPPLEESEALSDVQHTLFVVMGAVLMKKVSERGIQFSNYVCVDPEEDMETLAGLHDSFFVKEPLFIENYLENVFGRWLCKGVKPEEFITRVLVPEENFIFKSKF